MCAQTREVCHRPRTNSSPASMVYSRKCKGATFFLQILPPSFCPSWPSLNLGYSSILDFMAMKPELFFLDSWLTNAESECYFQMLPFKGLIGLKLKNKAKNGVLGFTP